MGLNLSGITSAQLRRAIKIKTKIESLENQLRTLLGASVSGGSYSGDGFMARRTMSPSGKRKIAAAQRKRWAAWRKDKSHK